MQQQAGVAPPQGGGGGNRRWFTQHEAYAEIDVLRLYRFGLST